MDRQAVRR